MAKGMEICHQCIVLICLASFGVFGRQEHAEEPENSCYNSNYAQIIINSLSKALKAFGENEEKLIIDALFGVYILKFKIEAINDDIKVDYNVVEPHEDKLADMWRKSRDILSRNSLQFEENLKFGVNFVDDIEICLREIFGCEVTDKCWKKVTLRKYTEYDITHQVLYFGMANMQNCQRQVMEFEGRHSTSEKSADIVKRFCNTIFEENRSFQKSNYEGDVKDLFLEQLAVCGIFNIFREDETCPRILDMISWQLSNGCFNDDVNDDDKISNVTRQKRSDLIILGNCSEHMTAVAFGGLVSTLHQLLRGTGRN